MKEIKLRFEAFLHHQNISEEIVPSLVFLGLLAMAIILLTLSVFVTRIVLRKLIGKIISKTKTGWDDLLIKHRLFKGIGFLVSVIVLKEAVPVLFEDWPKTLGFLNKVLDAYFVFVIIHLVVIFLKATEEHLSGSEVFIEKPLASYFQLFRIILYIIAFILALSIFLGKSPIYLLGAFGAMTAVLLLIFKDTILGLVASVQISANDMIRIGDWIEMPKYNTDGDVIAINLNTVKIQNFDKTITTIPTYYFVTESFKNWRGMQQSGGRRIKRNIMVNIYSIRFVTPEMMERFKKVELISDYLTERQKEIDNYNESRDINTDVFVNGRRMTNVGVFREYIQRYLQNHPGINRDLSLMVRQQPSNEFGLPLEIYCFTKSIHWTEYETIQSDIFDHVLASASFFGISIYQSPAGEDYQRIAGATA
ncbi:MAG: mechanosensitive ion channel family protein [Chitinophagaceae bacterium]|nr:mechanosensitive ion channel family protein [Chitinophagaceae bacterium]